jgi:hypothetical protein
MFDWTGEVLPYVLDTDRIGLRKPLFGVILMINKICG